MSIQPNATVVIRHKGAQVVTGRYNFWAASKWTRSKFKAKAIHGGQAMFTGTVPGLNLQAKGTINRVADNELRVQYRFSAKEEHPSWTALSISCWI